MTDRHPAIREPERRTPDEARCDCWNALYEAKRPLSPLAIAVRVGLTSNEVMRLVRYHDWFVWEQTSDGPLISIAQTTPRK